MLRAGTPRRRIAEVLERVRLDAESRTPAKHLSHGQRQWLEIALLLANAAERLLDEPTAGMTAEETHATGALIRSSRASSASRPSSSSTTSTSSAIWRHPSRCSTSAAS